MEIKHEEAMLPHEQRHIVIEGKRYHSATANRCTQCTTPDRYMFVKLKLAGGDITLECPFCELTLTVKESMVNLNLNKTT